MCDQATIDQIQDLLGKNWTYRTIAARLGISRESVADLVASTKETKPRKKPGPVPKRLLKFQPIPPTRCPRCGAMIAASPCVACYLRLIGATRPATDLDD